MPRKTEEVADFRAALRARQLAARAALGAAERAALDARLGAHLDAWCATRPDGARELGFCLPWKGEPDLLPALTRLAGQGWQFAVPVVAERARPMIFRRWWPAAPLGRDAHGLPCPEADACPECPAPDLLLLPVVAVDARGYRLGYGGGYFDRTLATLAAAGRRPLCLGVGYAQAQVPDIRPQAHDQPLSGLLDENGLRWY